MMNIPTSAWNFDFISVFDPKASGLRPNMFAVDAFVITMMIPGSDVRSRFIVIAVEQMKIGII